MFEKLAYFSSFIESIIALSFFLSAWKKPEEVFSDILKKSFSNKKILLTETKFWIDGLSKIFNIILRFARWISIPTIFYGLIILFLSGHCNYDDSQSICQYSIGSNNESIVIHLLIILTPILINIFAFALGLFYYIVTFVIVWIIVFKDWLIGIIKKIKEDKEKLSVLEGYTTTELQQLIKESNEPK